MKLSPLTVIAAVLIAFSTAHAGIKPLNDNNLKHREESGRPDVLLRIEVKAEYKELKGEVDFVTMNMTQCNNVTGGDRAYKIQTKNGEGLEFKKWGFIVNALPVMNPNVETEVDTQFQIELSGPIKGKDAINIETWQLQNEVLSTLGKWKVVSRKPALVKVRVSIDK